MNKILELTDKNYQTLSEYLPEKELNKKALYVILKTSFPTLQTIEQFAAALMIARKYQLDPISKEIWAWVDRDWKLISCASAEWFKKIARRQVWFISIEAHAVFEWEKFSMNAWSWIVSHEVDLEKRKWSYTWDGKDKKLVKVFPIWAWCRIRQTGKPDFLKFVNWDDYNKAWADRSVWTKYSCSMIEKCAITVSVRDCYWLSWLYWEEETHFMRWNTPVWFTDISEIDIEASLDKAEENIKK